MDNEKIKQTVRTYWNAQPCGTKYTQQERFSTSYFEEIEAFRYRVEPEIFSFAQFTRFRDKKVLEVGVGAGTDFLQWVRAGAKAHGIDLTQTAIDHVQHRLECYGVQAEELQVADAEHIPYPDNFFDLVYSWGVIHHSPDTIKCLEEIIRITKPGGTIKLMIYHRHSLFALYKWVRCALLKGKPFQSFSHVLFHHQESLGTKAYTHKEVHHIMQKYPVKITHLASPITNHDLAFQSKIVCFFAYFLSCLFGWHRFGWFMMIELKKELS